MKIKKISKSTIRKMESAARNLDKALEKISHLTRMPYTKDGRKLSGIYGRIDTAHIDLCDFIADQK